MADAMKNQEWNVLPCQSMMVRSGRVATVRRRVVGFIVAFEHRVMARSFMVASL